jgi:hypothetical protein
MKGEEEAYSAAADVAVTNEERLGLWPVYPFYEIREAIGDTYVVVPRNVPNEHARRLSLALVRRRVNHSSVEEGDAASQETIVSYPNNPRYYAPLDDHPDLFQRFARLGNQEHISTSTWLKWLHEFGVLGLRDLPGGRNDTEESRSDFAREARLANRTMKLFGAAANPDGPDIETIHELKSEVSEESIDAEELGRSILFEVKDTIRQKVQAECYWNLLLRDGSWRKKRKSPLAEKWAFRSLLGALWLQLMWLTISDDLRFCKAPGCNHPISPYDRPDRVTCSDRCRQRLSRSLRNARA